jgi:hypothetical protein
LLSVNKFRGENVAGNGWVKIHRKFLEWGWYQTPNMVHLFIHLLLSANHKQKEWQGMIIERGQLVTGLHSLKLQTGISTRSLRTCFERLKSTGELTIKTTNKFRIVTLTNYDSYQEADGLTDKQIDKQIDKQATNKRQTNDNKQECKEDKNVKNTTRKKRERFSEEGKQKFLRWVFLTDSEKAEFRAFFKSKGLTDADCKEAIRLLDNWYDNHRQARVFTTSDLGSLTGWCYRELLAVRAQELRLETQKSYHDQAELSAFQKAQA